MTDKFNRTVINIFLDNKNLNYLLDTLINQYNDIKITNYLKHTFKKHILYYVTQLEKDLMYVDPTAEIYKNDQDPLEQVRYANLTFFNHMEDLIDNDILAVQTNNKLNNYNISAINDNFNATTQTIISNMPQSVLSCQDTRWIDDPRCYVNNNEQSLAKTIDPNDPKSVRFKTYYKGNSKYSDGTSQYDKELQKWWYPRRPQELRDDPVGEINQNKNINKNTNNIEKNFKIKDTYNLCNQKFNFQQVKKNVETLTHNGFIHNGHTDETENGVYNNSFTGDNIDYSNNHVDRLLATPYIQNLNQISGEPNKPDVLSSTYQRGKYGRKENIQNEPQYQEYLHNNSQSNIKLWVDGDGFVDQSNDTAMKNLLDRRVFRSFNLGTDKNGKPTTNYGSHHDESAADQIPWFERALYNRYYERDVEESVGGFELDGMNRGYGKDMQSLYCRIPNKYVGGSCKINGKPNPNGYNKQTNQPFWE